MWSGAWLERGRSSVETSLEPVSPFVCRRRGSRVKMPPVEVKATRRDLNMGRA